MKRLPFFTGLRCWLRDAYTFDGDLDAISDLALELIGRRAGGFQQVHDAVKTVGLEIEEMYKRIEEHFKFTTPETIVDRVEKIMLSMEGEESEEGTRS